MLQTLTNLGTNLVYLGLAKIIVAQDETGSLFFKDDVEVNPGSYRKPNEALSICHWNSNNISIHTFTNLLKAYVKFDIICLSETYLDSSSPFDDNNFTSQSNWIVHSGTHPSQHTSCNHQIIYTKCNLKIQDSNDDLIRRAINQFNWKKAFENKNVDEKVLTFNETVLNILSNLILHELIVCV